MVLIRKVWGCESKSNTKGKLQYRTVWVQKVKIIEKMATLFTELLKSQTLESSLTHRLSHTIRQDLRCLSLIIYSKTLFRKKKIYIYFSTFQKHMLMKVPWGAQKPRNKFPIAHAALQLVKPSVYQGRSPLAASLSTILDSMTLPSGLNYWNSLPSGWFSYVSPCAYSLSISRQANLIMS